MKDEYLRTRRHNNRAAIFLFVIFLAWLPTYLLMVRPAMNAWLAHYVNSYPAVLHFIPILGPIVLLGWTLGKRYPAPQQPSGKESDK